jgi:hypothetical protein
MNSFFEKISKSVSEQLVKPVMLSLAIVLIFFLILPSASLQIECQFTEASKVPACTLIGHKGKDGFPKPPSNQRLPEHRGSEKPNFPSTAVKGSVAAASIAVGAVLLGVPLPLSLIAGAAIWTFFQATFS